MPELAHAVPLRDQRRRLSVVATAGRDAPSLGWRHPVLRQAGSAIQFLLVVGLLAALLYRGGAALDYTWQWNRLPQFLVQFDNGQVIWGTLATGLLATLQIAACAMACALAMAVVTAAARLSRSVSARWLGRLYVEIIRNTPLLVQINIFYFVVAPIFGIGRFWAGVLCLALFEGAFAAETLRAGILAVERGQWEAAASLGLPLRATYRLVVLPQALRIMLPPLIGIAVALIKDSSIVSVIALFELTTAGRDAIATTFMSFEVWFTVAAIYLVICASLSLGVQAIERKLRRAA